MLERVLCSRVLFRDLWGREGWEVGVGEFIARLLRIEGAEFLDDKGWRITAQHGLCVWSVSWKLWRFVVESGCRVQADVGWITSNQDK